MCGDGVHPIERRANKIVSIEPLACENRKFSLAIGTRNCEAIALRSHRVARHPPLTEGGRTLFIKETIWNPSVRFALYPFQALLVCFVIRFVIGSENRGTIERTVVGKPALSPIKRAAKAIHLPPDHAGSLRIPDRTSRIRVSPDGCSIRCKFSLVRLRRWR